MLLLLLALPVMIFLFLKLMGRNEFSIPVYYSSHFPADTLGCNINAKPPYQVNLPEMDGAGDKIILLDGGEVGLDRSEKNNLIRRIRNNSPANLNFIVYSTDASDSTSDSIVLSSEEWEELKCKLLTAEDRQLILIDELNRIRGYYFLDLEEVDRLLVELEILNIS
jgi:protein SCO1